MQITKPTTISERVEINGSEQWVYVHLSPHAKRTLLFLHGGPGWSDAPWAGVICKKLWLDSNTVHWDQRGSNRSYTIDNTDQKLTIDQMVKDGLALVELIGRKYGLLNPTLIGHSWGAMLGILMAQQVPEVFRRYIGIGQLVSNKLSEPVSWRFCQQRAGKLDRKDLIMELDKMGPDFYKDFKLMFRQREILFELGGEILDSHLCRDFMSLIGQSPSDYQSTREKLYESCDFSIEQLWQEIIQTDLFTRIKEITVPVTLIQGRYDFVTSSEIAKDWFDRLVCKGKKEFLWFENSAHWPHLEENEKFVQLLCH